MEFGWSAEDAAFRAELRAFLDATLPADWDEIAKDGPGQRRAGSRSRAASARRSPSAAG